MAVGDKIKVGAAGVELSVIDKTKDGFEKAKANAKKEAGALQNQLNNIKIQMDDRLLKLKLNDIQSLHKKLKQRLEEKIKLNYDLQSIEITRKQLEATTNALRDLKKESEKKSKSSGVSGIGGDFFSSATGLSAAQLGVAGIAAGVGVIAAESVRASIEIEGIRNAFNKLNDPNLLEELRKATRGTVNDFELMRSTVRAANFKIPIQELATYFEFAQKRASETGESVDYLVESIVLGIGRKSPLILDNLGISAVALRQKFGDVGLESASIGDISKAMSEIVREELNNMGDVALTTKDNISEVKAELDNIKVGIGDLTIETTNWFIELSKSRDKIQTIYDLLNDTEGKEQRKKDAQRAYNKELTESIRLTREKVQEDNKTANSDQIGQRLDNVRKRIAEFSKLPLNTTIEDLEKYFNALQGEGKLRFAPLITELKEYIQLHNELKKVFDPYQNTLGQIEIRIESLKNKLTSFKPGDAGLAQTRAEIEKLEKILNPEKPKEKKKIELDFSEFDLIQEDYAWLDEVIAKENELAKIRDENLQVYIDARNELSEDEKKELEERLKKEEEIHNLRMNAISEFGNALEGLSAHGKTFVSYFNAALQAALKISDALDTMKTDQLSGILGIASGGLGFITKLLGLKSGGSVTNFGGGNVSYQPHQKFASGVNNFVVPPGYNRDNYLVGVQSGERLSVTPANARSTTNHSENSYSKLIADRIGAMNSNMVELMNAQIKLNVNKVLSTKIDHQNILFSTEIAQKIREQYY